MSQNGQTHFKNLAANAERFLNCAWTFWDIMHWRFKEHFFDAIIKKTRIWSIVLIIFQW